MLVEPNVSLGRDDQRLTVSDESLLFKLCDDLFKLLRSHKKGEPQGVAVGALVHFKVARASKLLNPSHRERLGR